MRLRRCRLPAAAFAATAVLLGAAGLHYSVATSLLTRHFDRVGRAIGVNVAGRVVAFGRLDAADLEAGLIAGRSAVAAVAVRRRSDH